LPDGPRLAYEITRLFTAGQLDLSSRPNAPEPGWDAMPEVAMANKLRGFGATDTDVRLYVTFTSALDRARDATYLWTKSAELFAGVRWPFSPEDVASRPIAELKEVLRESGVSQRHSPDSAGWRRLRKRSQTRHSPPIFGLRSTKGRAMRERCSRN
jgi:hypothetical protein